jgi:hypothetical protein
VGGKARAAEIVFLKTVALDHHAPGAVEQKNAAARLLLQPADTGGTVEAHLLSFLAVSFKPKIRQVA